MHSFQLRNEGEVGSFLGNAIKTIKDKFELTKAGLIPKVVSISGKINCNSEETQLARYL
jgi:hypothetical protein